MVVLYGLGIRIDPVKQNPRTKQSMWIVYEFLRNEVWYTYYHDTWTIYLYSNILFLVCILVFVHSIALLFAQTWIQFAGEAAILALLGLPLWWLSQTVLVNFTLLRPFSNVKDTPNHTLFNGTLLLTAKMFTLATIVAVVPLLCMSTSCDEPWHAIPSPCA